MSYDDAVTDVVKVVEAVGVAVMVLGALGSFIAAVPDVVDPSHRPAAYLELRRALGRSILLGLEVLILADIIRTIIVTPTVESVLVLGVIVVIRIVLSFSLEVEIDGAWPWHRRAG